MNEPLRPLNLGEILDRTFQVYRAKFLVFVGLGAIPVLAMRGIHAADSAWLHLSTLVHPSDQGGTWAWNSVVWLGFYHISSFVGLLILPASVKLASDVILGMDGSIISSLQFAASRWRSYIWVAVLKLSAQLIAPELLMFALIFGAAFIGYVTSAPNNGEGFITFLVFLLPLAGFVLFVWLGGCLSLAVPACALEGRRGIAVLRRSWSLSKGTRGRVILTWLMVMILLVLLMVGARVISGWVVYLFWPGHRLGAGSQHLFNETVSWLYSAISALVGPIYAIALTLIYYDQRIRHEGYDIERMMDAAGLGAPVTSPFTEGSSAIAEGEGLS